MLLMRPEHWARVRPLLNDLLDLAEPERATHLARLRAQEPALADELAALLADHQRAQTSGFLAQVLAPPAPSPASTLAGQRLGAYVLEAPLGQGGGGVVWRARREDGRFEGAVAIKLLHLSLMGQAGAERFRREGHILARLKHPHIASLLDAGVSPGGQPYLVIELVEGERIDRHCDAHRLGVPARLALFDDVLAAVAHAHTHGVIHRDLKPGNILVTADGTVKLLDFGIAKLLDDEAGAAPTTELTREGARALTPEYAAPEQLRGEGVTTATDVYALGVLLYQLLSGQHPTANARGHAAEQMRATLETEPMRLSRCITVSGADQAALRDSSTVQLRRSLAGDLDNIVGRALRKLPTERYPTVAALADDLTRYQLHQPVQARPDSLRYRARKFIRRNRVAVAAGIVTSAAIAAGLVGTGWMATQARSAAQRAAEQRDLALDKVAQAQDVGQLVNLITTAMPASGQFTRDALLARSVQAIAQRSDLSDARRATMLLALSQAANLGGDLGLAVRLAGQAHALTRNAADVAARAQAACQLASLLSQQEDAAQAQALITTSLRELGPAPRHVPARIHCLLYAADGDLEQGQHPTALAHAEAALALLPQLELADLAMERATWSRVAQARRATGQLASALAAYAHLANLDTRLGPQSTVVESTRLQHWASVLHAAGRPLEARDKLQQALRLYDNNALAPPGLLAGLARAQLQLGLRAEALATAQQAQARSLAVNNLSQSYVAQWTQVVALHQLGRDAESQALLAPLERELRSRLPANHYVFSLVLGLRGLMASEPAQAQTLLD
jgi:serine/threonine-protein kinase